MFLDFFSHFFFFKCVVICIGRADNTIEENNEDVPEAMGMQGQSFAVYESDSEDDELEFLDSFV